MGNWMLNNNHKNQNASHFNKLAGFFVVYDSKLGRYTHIYIRGSASIPVYIVIYQLNFKLRKRTNKNVRNILLLVIKRSLYTSD